MDLTRIDIIKNVCMVFCGIKNSYRTAVLSEKLFYSALQSTLYGGEGHEKKLF